MTEAPCHEPTRDRRAGSAPARRHPGTSGHHHTGRRRCRRACGVAVTMPFGRYRGAPLEQSALRPFAAEIVAVGYRALARRAHPDAGGDHETMIRLTDARDALSALLGAA
jgi:hypothetical protein